MLRKGDHGQLCFRHFVSGTDVVKHGSDLNRRNGGDEEVEHVFFPNWDLSTDNGTFYIKVRGNPDAAFASIRSLVRQVNPLLSGW